MIFDADPTSSASTSTASRSSRSRPQAALSAAQEFIVASAGFWVQQATNEWLLTDARVCGRERAPFAKGVFAFNVAASAAYAGAAFARTGPVERDTRGMASSSGIDERWVGALILAPAVLDTWRYFDPDAKWPIWGSRAAKILGVLLMLK